MTAKRINPPPVSADVIARVIELNKKFTQKGIAETLGLTQDSVSKILVEAGVHTLKKRNPIYSRKLLTTSK